MDKDIIEYARTLYLEPDEYLDHRYNNEEIRSAIRERFGRTIQSNRLKKWIFGWKNDWRDKIEKARINGAIRSKDPVMQSYAKLGKSALGKLAVAMNRNEVSARELITITKLGIEAEKAMINEHADMAQILDAMHKRLEDAEHETDLEEGHLDH